MYIVLEIWQPTPQEMLQTTSYSKSTRDEAMATYHYILHEAAVSSYYKHGAIVIDAEGQYIARESFTHNV